MEGTQQVGSVPLVTGKVRCIMLCIVQMCQFWWKELKRWLSFPLCREGRTRIY